MENKDNKKQDLEPETIIIDINPEENKNNNSSIRQKKIEMVSTNMNKVDNNFSGHDVIIIGEDGNDDISKSPRNHKEIIIEEHKNNNLVEIKVSEPIIEKEEDKLNDILYDKTYNDMVFFFINPASGSKEGQQVINMGVKKVEFIDTYKCSAFIFNIRDRTNYLEGVEVLRACIKLNLKSLPRVVIGGGDGTVLSSIEEFITLGINVQKCLFAVLPLGTGNDLANSLGWGTSINISSDMAEFKIIVQEILEATCIILDVWELKLTVDEKEGGIIQVVGENGEKTMRKDEKSNRNITKYTRSFINYFSLGYDARVGFGFDKLRTSNRCCNKFIYFWEGCKKSCCRKTIRVNGFIESFSTLKVDDNNFFESFPDEKIKKIGKEEVFRTKTIDLGQPHTYRQPQENLAHTKTAASLIFNKKIIPEEYTEVVLKGDPVAIICQNINNYMGGVSDIWKNSTSLGIELFNPNPEPGRKVNEKAKKEEEKRIFQDLMKAEQHFGDGKLEFFGFDTGLSFGLEKIFSGFANKIYQGSGPIWIKFKDYGTQEKEDKENRVYLNIDGEYFNLVKPKDLKVRANKKFEGGKIKFLRKK